jgi:hypothetical protein
MMDLFFSNMDLFISYYQLILIPLWPVLWDYKVPIFEVPIMGTFTNSDEDIDPLVDRGRSPLHAINRHPSGPFALLVYIILSCDE